MNEENLTLKDIENAISILEKFVKMSRKAERILRRIAPPRTGMYQGDLMQTLMNTLIQQRTENFEELEDVELTPEELETIKKIRESKKKEEA